MYLSCVLRGKARFVLLGPGTVLHFEIGAVIDGKVNWIWSRGEASEWGK